MGKTAWVVLFIGIAAACSSRADAPPLPSPPSNLEPVLLRDGEQTAAYISSFPAKDYRILRVRGLGDFFIDEDPTPVKQQIRSGRPWEPEAIKIFSVFVSRGSVVLDVGANIGGQTIPLARRVGPGGRVYAFEPLKKNYRELVKNLELNAIQNVVPLRFAAGENRAIIEMTPSRGKGAINQAGRGSNRAEMRPLDDFGFSGVSFIKIDAGGAELSVLRGAKQTIRRCRPVLLIEIPGYARFWTQTTERKVQITAVTTFLSDLGYKLDFAYHAGESHCLATYSRVPIQTEMSPLASRTPAPAAPSGASKNGGSRRPEQP